MILRDYVTHCVRLKKYNSRRDEQMFHDISYGGRATCGYLKLVSFIRVQAVTSKWRMLAPVSLDGDPL